MTATRKAKIEKRNHWEISLVNVPHAREDAKVALPIFLRTAVQSATGVVCVAKIALKLASAAVYHPFSGRTLLVRTESRAK